MTRAEALRRLKTTLPAHEAEALLRHALGEDRARFFARLRDPLPPQAWETVYRLAARRLAGEPLQLLVGHVSFFGLPLEVRAGVLIPRPETEGLVERALMLLEGKTAPRVLDVGTGSGAIALAIKHTRPDAEVLASEIDPRARALAEENAKRLGLALRVIEAPFTAGVRELDLIVANPPYLPQADQAGLPPELAYEPPTALFAGEDGLAVARPLAAEALSALRPGGHLLMELDPRNVFSLALELARLGYVNVQVGFDLAGRPRYLLGRRPGTAPTKATGEVKLA